MADKRNLLTGSAMNKYNVTANTKFIGRAQEQARLDEICQKNEAQFIVVYGRRRVGKTELIEQYFQKRKILKFEGIEIPSEDQRTSTQRQTYQIHQCLERLAVYLENSLIAKLTFERWTEFFQLLNDVAAHKNIVLYFEEVQWLANYQAGFFAELKLFWDDAWRHNPKLTLVLCGSSTSFIVKNIVSDRALYGRVQEEIHLRPFQLNEVEEFMHGLGRKEIMTAQLCVGGIPEYLKRLCKKGSVFTRLCQQSFLPNAYFLQEKDKIFVSSLSNNKHYERIIQFLSQRRFATATEIARFVRGKEQTGGSLTAVLDDLEECGFIERQNSVHKDDNSKLVRFCISDESLQWYFSFIHPIKSKIQSGQYQEDPLRAINRRSLETMLGFSFERWCRKNAHLFAKILGFSGMEYQSGPYFAKSSGKKLPGCQIDLVYIIKGSKVVLCEIKYYDGLVGNSVCEDMKDKAALFRQALPKYKNYTFESVLITPEGVKDHKTVDAVFDRVITFNEIFGVR
jgi:AAA+ ATPase superfamily predicted ATPase